MRCCSGLWLIPMRTAWSHSAPAILHEVCRTSEPPSRTCVTGANLLMARGIARRKEVAIRTALYAGRFRIARQFLLESALIALLSGGVSILLTFWGIGLLLPFTPPTIPLARGVTVDATVLGFTLLVSSITALMTGIVPAVRLSRGKPAEMIRAEGRAASRERNRIAGALVA